MSQPTVDAAQGTLVGYETRDGVAYLTLSDPRPTRTPTR